MTRRTTGIVLLALGAFLISARSPPYAVAQEQEEPGSHPPSIAIEKDGTPLELVELSLTGLAEALVGFEVLEILALGPRGKHRAAISNGGPSKRVARCRVVDHLHGRVEDDGTFFLVLRPAHELITAGEEGDGSHRYLSSLDHDHLISGWAAKTGATGLRKFIGETPVFRLSADPLHFIAGVRDSPALEPSSPSSYAAFVSALRELLAKRLPRITFSFVTTGLSRWSALIEPGGRVAFSGKHGLDLTSESWVLEEGGRERVRSALEHLPAPGPWINVGGSLHPGDSCVQVKVRDATGVVTINVYSNAADGEPTPATRALGILAETSRLLERDLLGLEPFRAFVEQDRPTDPPTPGR